jgi:chromosome segregation ATPase
MNKSELTTKIRELDAAMDEIDNTIQERQREIGHLLLDAQWDQNPSTRVQNQLTTAQRLRHELDDLKITRTRLDEAQQRKEQIQAEKKELNRRITKSMNDVEPYFEEIGRLAFDVYRTNPVVDSAAEEIFAPLLNKFNEIKTADRDVARLADERKRGRNPMGQLMTGGRLLFERSKQQLRKTNLASLYTAAGRQVCTSGLIDRLDDPKLEQAAGPYFEARRHIETAEAKLQELEKEEENLELERMTLLDGKGVNERRAQLMTMLRNREEGLEQALRELGRSYAVAKSRPRVEPDVAHLIDELQDLYERRKRCERKRKRVDAAVQILEIDEDRDGKEASIEELRQERDRIDRRMGEIREELSQEEERRKRLVKARGKVDDLLD